MREGSRNCVDSGSLPGLVRQCKNLVDYLVAKLPNIELVGQSVDTCKQHEYRLRSFKSCGYILADLVRLQGDEFFGVDPVKQDLENFSLDFRQANEALLRLLEFAGTSGTEEWRVVDNDALVNDEGLLVQAHQYRDVGGIVCSVPNQSVYHW